MPVSRGEHPIVIPRPADARPGELAPWRETGWVPSIRGIESALAGRVALGEEMRRVAPDAREAAVLAPLMACEAGDEILFVKRTGEVPSHRGEIAFPGGGRHPEDSDLWATALREVHEEVGVPPAAVRRIGELDMRVTVGSRYSIAPFVAELDPGARIHPEPREVARAIRVPLARLVEGGVYHQEIWPWPGGERPIHFFELDEEDVVWGATASILFQLMALAFDAAGR